MEGPKEKFPSQSKEKLPVVKKTEAEFTEKVDAEDLVRDFWNNMPHGADILHVVERTGDWSQELTMGDRTNVIRGITRDKRGKWFAVFQGNHQPLTDDAVRWLIDRGYIQVEK